MFRASILALALLTSSGAALAQGPASGLEGRTVRGANGAVLGVVEKVQLAKMGHDMPHIAVRMAPREVLA